MWTGWSWLRIGTGGGHLYGDEPSCSKNAGNFLTSCRVRFSRGTLLHGVSKYIIGVTFMLHGVSKYIIGATFMLHGVSKYIIGVIFML